jgi:hypothetical protein
MIWRDLVEPMLKETKPKSGFGNRIDIATIADLIEFEEGREEHRWGSKQGATLTALRCETSC